MSTKYPTYYTGNIRRLIQLDHTLAFIKGVTRLGNCSALVANSSFCPSPIAIWALWTQRGANRSDVRKHSACILAGRRRHSRRAGRNFRTAVGSQGRSKKIILARHSFGRMSGRISGWLNQEILLNKLMPQQLTQAPDPFQHRDNNNHHISFTRSPLSAARSIASMTRWMFTASAKLGAVLVPFRRSLAILA